MCVLVSPRNGRYVCKLRPTDRDARGKLTECDKEIKRIAFEAAIAVEEGPGPCDRIDPDSICACVHAHLGASSVSGGGG